jgi:hypothetical protein
MRFDFAPGAQLRQLIDERTRTLRTQSYADLRTFINSSPEGVEIAGRRGTLTTVVRECPHGVLHLVIKAVLPGRFLRILQTTEVRAFDKHADGSVSVIADPESPYLFDRAHWCIKDVKDLSLFFEALPRLIPTDSLLGLAGAFTSRELMSLLPLAHGLDGVRSLPDPFPDEFRDATFFPVSDAITRDLLQLQDRRAWPGFILFLVVISQGESLLEWFDLPDDPISVALSISEQAVRDFAVATGSSYERVQHS